MRLRLSGSLPELRHSGKAGSHPPRPTTRVREVRVFPGWAQKCSSCLTGSSQVDVPARVRVAFQVHASERGVSQKLNEALRLTRLAHQSIVLLFSNHHHAFLTLASNALWPFGACFAEDLAEAGLGALNLPGIAGSFQAGRSMGDLRAVCLERSWQWRPPISD
jgi:hypothetical protein